MGREVRGDELLVTEGLVLDCQLPTGHDWAVGSEHHLRYFPDQPEFRLGLRFSVLARVNGVVRVKGGPYVLLPPPGSDAAPVPLPSDDTAPADLVELTAIRELALEALGRSPARHSFAYAAVRDHPLNSRLASVVGWFLGHSFQTMALLREHVEGILRTAPPLEAGPRCTPHFLLATKTCDRCGAFWCPECEWLLWKFATCRLCLESPPSLLREVDRFVEASRLRWIALGTAVFGLLLRPYGHLLGALGAGAAVASLFMARGLLDRWEVLLAVLGIAVSIVSVVRGFS